MERENVHISKFCVCKNGVIDDSDDKIMHECLESQVVFIKKKKIVSISNIFTPTHRIWSLREISILFQIEFKMKFFCKLLFTFIVSQILFY